MLDFNIPGTSDLLGVFDNVTTVSGVLNFDMSFPTGGFIGCVVDCLGVVAILVDAVDTFFFSVNGNV